MILTLKKTLRPGKLVYNSTETECFKTSYYIYSTCNLIKAIDNAGRFFSFFTLIAC